MPPIDKAGRAVAGLIRGTSRPIRAYHGSPHSFSRFDASKVGTGEGAQAYGHGLYFAGREGVARQYRDISPAVPSGPSAEVLQEITEALVPLELEGSRIRRAMEQAAEARGELSAGWGNVRSVPPDVLQKLGPRLQAVNDEINKLRLRQEQVRNNSRGHMYEVEIDYPEESLLDWDAPMSRQQPIVQRLFGDLAMDMSGDGGRVYRDIATRRGEEFDDDMTGVLADRAASQELLAEGIPGIRYLDQGSRSSGQGTRNYVMFPGTEDRIRILRQYGWMLPMAAAGASGQEPGPP